MAIETRISRRETVFSDWKVKEYIGSGSGGKTAVFRIVREHEGWEEVSALKVINVLEELGTKETLAEAYRQEYDAEREELCMQAGEELRLMSCLRGNSSIVEYYDFAFVDYQEEHVFGTDLLIRMELLENLREEQKKKGEYSEAEIIRIGKDICKSLEICHKAGIIHRDIKPANIFVTSWGEYKLGDFGIARMVDAGQKASTKMGTRAYAAPEQFMSHRDKYDKRVDIYSLGLTLYELANHNKLPFASSGYVRESEIQLRLMGKELPAPDCVSPMVGAVIQKACSFDADRRYASAEEFESDLCKAQEGTLVMELPPEPVEMMDEKEEDLKVEEPDNKDSKRSLKKLLVVGLGVLLAVAIIWLMILVLGYVLSVDVESGVSVHTSEESIPDLPELSMRIQEISKEYKDTFGKVATLETSYGNTAVITSKGDLYIWGNNSHGQVGCGNTEDQSEPVLIMKDVASVCLSETHTAAITKKGELYLWGSNQYAQIGNDSHEDQLTPLLIMEDVQQVSLGTNHSGALCTNGDLYAWGYSTGTGTGEEQGTPQLIANDIASFSMNDCEGAAVSKYGDLYVWGMSWTTQSQFVEKYPTKILEEVAQVQVGETTVAALKVNGELYVWGFNKWGQVGDGNMARQAMEPVLVMENVKTMALGSEHTAAITLDGELYMWGFNQHGQLGTTEGRCQEVPVKIADNVASVYPGVEGTAFIKENGVLYFCGSNENNQIADSTDPYDWRVAEPVAMMKDVVSAGVCGEANYALTEKGRLYRFGQYNVMLVEEPEEE